MGDVTGVEDGCFRIRLLVEDGDGRILLLLTAVRGDCGLGNNLIEAQALHTDILVPTGQIFSGCAPRRNGRYGRC